MRKRKDCDIAAIEHCKDQAREIFQAFMNGSITVELPDGIGADVTARTINGAIETDFPLTVSGRFSHRRLSGSIGGGGEQISLVTVNGSVSLVRGR